jgi:hypothetical protein
MRTISIGFILLFSCMNTKYSHYIHSHSPFPYAHLPIGEHNWYPS